MADMSISSVGDRSPPPGSMWQGKDRRGGKAGAAAAESAGAGAGAGAEDEEQDAAADKDTLGQFIDFIA